MLFWIFAALLAALAMLPVLGALERSTLVIAAALVAGGLALVVFLQVGAPHLPDQPLAPRLDHPPEELSPPALAARMETHLASMPQDGQGWQLLAPLYLAMFRYEEALHAYRRALDLTEGLAVGEKAELFAGYGEAQVLRAGGVVEREAAQSFRRALTFAPKNWHARYYMALHAKQAGNAEEAMTLWRTLATELPENSSMHRAVVARLAEYDKP